jgi:hypothetical protein
VHQAEPAQLLLKFVSAPGRGAPLALDIDQILDSHGLDEPGLPHEMNVAHRSCLDALETNTSSVGMRPRVSWC